MKVYKLNYQHHKDIVDDNVLTMFVTADNQDEVEAFAKKLHYKIEHLSPLTKKEFELIIQSYIRTSCDHSFGYRFFYA